MNFSIILTRLRLELYALAQSRENDRKKEFFELLEEVLSLKDAFMPPLGVENDEHVGDSGSRRT